MSTRAPHSVRQSPTPLRPGRLRRARSRLRRRLELQKHSPRRTRLRMTFPPAFNVLILRGTPRGALPDLRQEAWLAYLTGRNPNTAARNFLAREFIHGRRELPMSQVPTAALGRRGV